MIGNLVIMCPPGVFDVYNKSPTAAYAHLGYKLQPADLGMQTWTSHYFTKYSRQL